MPISNITNGESGFNARKSLNQAIDAINGLGDSSTLDVGTTAGTVCAGDDSRLSNDRTPTAHAATHTNGTDDIQDATASQKGLATATQITKLDGIKALADVTDATNVGSSIGGATPITTLGGTDQIPVTQSNVLKTITYTALNALLAAIYQAKAAILSTFSALSNSSGVLTNDGSGNLSWQTPGGGGDVVGPASATDNAIARFNTTTGKLIQDSGITIADGATGTLSGTNTGDQTIALTGDVTGSGAGSFAATLATVNSNVGSFGSATASVAVTVNAKGLITAASTNTITPAVGSITGLGTGVATALAVNVGSAGAPVVNGGALGTPSGGDASNLSGTAASLTVGTATAANGLNTATTTVAVSSATAPSSGQVLTATSSTAATWQTPSGGGGKLAQVISASTSTAGSTTAVIPYDNTLPQISEGASVGIDVAITPINSGSTLIIDIELNVGASNVATEVVAALFVDSTANALRAADTTIVAGGMAVLRFRYIVSAASTTARTYRVRYGTGVAGTANLNRSNSNATLFGGALISSMTATEILP